MCGVGVRAGSEREANRENETENSSCMRWIAGLTEDKGDP